MENSGRKATEVILSMYSNPYFFYFLLSASSLLKGLVEKEDILVGRPTTIKIDMNQRGKLQFFVSSLTCHGFHGKFVDKTISSINSVVNLQ